MNDSPADALVFFGATGDLAFKKIFPALQAMVKSGRLDVPVIGVAGAGWTLEQLRARARDSIETHDKLDPAAFNRLAGLLRYVDGDCLDGLSMRRVGAELGVEAMSLYGYFPSKAALLDAVVCRLLADLELPTEAQWEYAARAGSDSVWWTGDEVASLQGAANNLCP